MSEKVGWVKCVGCQRVYAKTDAERHEHCTRHRTDTQKKASALQVAKWRATEAGAEYTKKYAKAQRLAAKRLQEEHYQEYARMLAEARREVGL